MKKKISSFLITVLTLTLCITPLVGTAIAGNAKGKNKASFWATGEAYVNYSPLTCEKLWLSPTWETSVYAGGDPEVVHYRGTPGEFGVEDSLVVKIDGVELQMDITCMMVMDLEFHKPVFSPFSTDFIRFRVTKTSAFDGYVGTIVCELNL